MNFPFFKLNEMKRRTQIAIGIVLIPVFFTLFMLDRAICVFLPWMTSHSIKAYFDTTNYMILALYRVLAFFGILGIVELLKWIF